MSKLGTIALALACTLFALSCGGGGGGSTPTGPSNPGTGGGTTNPATVTITITGKGGNLAFSPNPATVAPGQFIVFKNNDTETHHVILDDGSAQTADIPGGATTAPMAIGSNKSYHCIIHPGMVGGFNGTEVEPPPNCNQAYCFGGGD
jgi:plastocyanin